jgi:hypothetical protein
VGLFFNYKLKIMPSWEGNNEIRLNDAVIEVDDSVLLTKSRDDLQPKNKYLLNIGSYITGLVNPILTTLGLKADKSILINTTSPLQGGGNLSTNRTLSIQNATSLQTGALTSADWNTFNNKVSNATHTGEVTGATTLTITNSAVTNAKLANMPANTIKGVTTAGTPINLTSAQVNSIISTFSVVTATGVFPNSRVIYFGSGATAMTGTIPTASMIVGQRITISRNTGATGTLTLKGQSGQIEALNNVLGATTSLAAAGAYGQNTDFQWNGTNLVRINNG